MKVLNSAIAGFLLLASLQASAFPTAAGSAGMRYYKSGQPAPAQYVAESNVIKDYHHYHLTKPTEGYEWVHGVDNDYLLVSTKTAIIRRIENRPNIPPEK